MGTWLSVDTPGFASFVVTAVALFHELLHPCNYSWHRSKVDSGELAVAGAAWNWLDCVSLCPCRRERLNFNSSYRHGEGTLSQYECEGIVYEGWKNIQLPSVAKVKGPPCPQKVNGSARSPWLTLSVLRLGILFQKICFPRWCANADKFLLRATYVPMLSAPCAMANQKQ